MDQLSGLAVSGRNLGILWVHNDGQIDEIFAIDTSGRPLGTFALNEELEDVEDIAIGPGPVPGGHYLYIGDLGDDQMQRQNVVVVRALEPAVSLDPEDPPKETLENATFINLTYPDSPHDAESLMVDPTSGNLYIVTKEEGRGRIFMATQKQLTNGANIMLEYVGDVPLSLVSAADISADGSQIALRNKKAALLWEREPGETIVQALAKPGMAIPLARDEPNGEALGFEPLGTGYYTVSEGEDQPIYFIRRNDTGYSPGQKLGSVSAPKLIELSGIAASRRNPGVLWVHNDGLNRQVFALSTNGVLLRTFEFSEDLLDSEDIAVGPGPSPGSHYLYVGDIGDNGGERENIRIFRAIEPEIGLGQLGLVTAFTGVTILTLQYPDGAHDAEALFIDPIHGDLFLATKEPGRHRLYQASRAELESGGLITLTFVREGSQELISGGDISSDGRQIALRRENSAWLWQRSAGQTVAEALESPSREIPVIGRPEEPNGEGIAFGGSGRGYYTISEGEDPPIYSFNPLDLPPLRFGEPPVQTTEGWRLLIRGCPPATANIQASSDLIAWHDIGSVTAREGETSFLDSVAKSTNRFYRLVRMDLNLEVQGGPVDVRFRSQIPIK